MKAKEAQELMTEILLKTSVSGEKSAEISEDNLLGFYRSQRIYQRKLKELKTRTLNQSLARRIGRRANQLFNLIRSNYKR